MRALILLQLLAGILGEGPQHKDYNHHLHLLCQEEYGPGWTSAGHMYFCINFKGSFLKKAQNLETVSENTPRSDCQGAKFHTGSPMVGLPLHYQTDEESFDNLR